MQIPSAFFSILCVEGYRSLDTAWDALASALRPQGLGLPDSGTLADRTPFTLTCDGNGLGIERIGFSVRKFNGIAIINGMLFKSDKDEAALGVDAGVIQFMHSLLDGGAAIDIAWFEKTERKFLWIRREAQTIQSRCRLLDWYCVSRITNHPDYKTESEEENLPMAADILAAIGIMESVMGAERAVESATGPRDALQIGLNKRLRAGLSPERWLEMNRHFWRDY